MVKRFFFILPFVFLAWFSCSNNKRTNQENKLFTLLDPDSTGINFTNSVTNSPDFNIFSYRNFYNGGGVAIGDINNDGLQDVFLTSNMNKNQLFLNKGNMKFEDITSKAGIGDEEKWSTGVSFVDINQDGWLDIYVCNAGFRKNSNAANTLFINNKDLTFSEQASKYGLDDQGYTTHAAFFDYDLDGDLDVYILNNSFIPVNTLNYSNARELRAKDWPVKDFLKGGGDKLLKNENGKFVDVSEEANIYGSLIGFGLGVTVGDVNEDSYPDIYVSNDFFERDYLYINNQKGGFTEELEKRTHKLSTSSMGADMGDLDNDGKPEIFVTDMLPYDETRLKTTTSFDPYNLHKLKITNGFYHQYLQNSLQWNKGDGYFIETAFYAGVAASDWSWGALMFDADMDTKMDIFVCNGIYHDVIDQDFIDFFANEIIQKMVLTGEKEALDSVINKMPSVPVKNVAFQNNGDLTFNIASEKWGFTQNTFSNGAAYGDLDNDGDLDLVINNVNQPSMVYQNNAMSKPGTHFIGFQISSSEPNTFGIGTKCYVHATGTVLYKELFPNRGFQSSVDTRLVFGLGNHSTIDSVVIIWPDKTSYTLLSPKVNQYHNISKTRLGSTPRIIKPNALRPYFSQIPSMFDSHAEDDHVDFYYERNIPEMLSYTGPALAVGDVNKDGFEDIYVGGASGQAGQLYLGSSKGYQKKQNPIFDIFAPWEDTEAIFFDADKDGDQDLFVGSGGNIGPQNTRELQDRMYINDGTGIFSINDKALPANGYNTSVAVPMDFNNDGFTDLFVGSVSFPGEYGLPPRHFLYKNNGNATFTDVLIQMENSVAMAGMIRDAAWEDLNEDGMKELVVVGDWMAPSAFQILPEKIIKINLGLDKYTGFWQSVVVTDINLDKRPDLVLGNVGTNSYLFNKRYLPVYLFSHDFDNNGTREKILGRTVNGKIMPVVMKRDMTDQLPFLKKKNLKHADYASKDLFELLGHALPGADKLIVSHTESIIAMNEGRGKFTTAPLPLQVQLSSVNKMFVKDFNFDGYPDLLLGGNKQHFLPMFGILDGNTAVLLLNDKKSNFYYTPEKLSGLQLRGICNDIKEANGQFILALNNDVPAILKRN